MDKKKEYPAEEERSIKKKAIWFNHEDDDPISIINKGNIRKYNLKIMKRNFNTQRSKNIMTVLKNIPPFLRKQI